MALNGATLQQQLTVHNTGAEPEKLVQHCATISAIAELVVFHLISGSQGDFRGVKIQEGMSYAILPTLYRSFDSDR